MKKGKLLVFSAPSGSGKTTLTQHLLKQKALHLEFSVSATSRKPRGKEKDGKEYHFLSKEIFKNKIKNGDFLEWEEVYEGYFYGTLFSEVENIWQKGKNVIFDIDVRGALNIKKMYPKETLAIFIKAPNLEIMEKRLKKRNTDAIEMIENRMKKAHFEMDFAGKFDGILINDDLEKAKKEIVNLVNNFLKS